MDGMHLDVRQSPPPSATSVSSVGREDSSEQSKRTKRSFLTQNACTRCRQKKSKCDGKRPTCERCRKHSADCVYDVAQEGLTRMQSMQQQLEAMSEDSNRLRTLIDTLRHGTDQVASNVLARLRLGDSIESLLESISEMQANPNGPEAQPRQDSQPDFPQPTPEGRQQNSVGSHFWTSWSSRCDDPAQQIDPQLTLQSLNVNGLPHDTPMTDGESRSPPQRPYRQEQKEDEWEDQAK